jgi:hypothetical protein
LSVSSLLAIAGVLAIKGQFVVDDEQLRLMTPRYQKRDQSRAHAHRPANPRRSSA